MLFYSGSVLLCITQIMSISPEENNKLAELFREMSLMYKYMGVRERFRYLAFQKAARVIKALPQSIRNYTPEEIDAFPGIGESIVNSIKEYLASGTIKRSEYLRKKTPYQLMDILEIKGVGPQILKKIVSSLRVRTRNEFVEALQAGRIGRLQGFGPAKMETMLRGLKLYKEVEDRMLLWDALALGEKVAEWLRVCPGVIKAEVAGSIRRKKETIGDIDILVACKDDNRQEILKYFTSGSFVGRVILKGEQRASIILSDPKKQVDLRLIAENNWGAALQYFTGSREHNIHLRTIARSRGFKISEYGIFRLDTAERLGGLTEDDIYTTLGYQIMPPEMREDKGEILLSQDHKIPSLVSIEDMKGDFHVHSTWSDGLRTPEEIYRHLREQFKYEYVVITDHSKSSRIAKGMNEKQILQQIKAIKELNKKMGSEFIKTGIEVDILKDGQLDISNEILSQLDWVTASVHSQFDKDNTARIIRACENLYVCCIGHPTGRLIGQRHAYKVDISELSIAAHRTGTALEINAQPSRMDLKDDYAMEARRRGVKLVIGTDSHTLQEFDFMRLGVSIARRAWCKYGNVLNTGSWSDIEKFKEIKRQHMNRYSANFRKERAV